jgi:D-3-phosphoglycerate dehydrogenase / 2-oxoglutarate reductase
MAQTNQRLQRINGKTSHVTNNHSPFRVMITDRFEIDSFAHLKSDPRLDVVQSKSHQPTADELSQVDGLIIRSRTRVDEAFLAQAPRLKVIVTSTSGFDHLDLTATHSRGVRVMYTPEANAASACELTWSLVLACARKLVDAHRAVKNGEWRRDALLGVQLSGKTYGVIGLGRIGTRVAKVAQAFGMKTMAFDPYKDDEVFEALGIQRISLEEMMKLADFVSVHVPASDETHYMLTRNLLDSANRNLILVNTSRGSVVSEQDLVEALTLEWIAACGLDVFEKEPLQRHSGLMALKNVVLSPHIGATTHEAFAQASREAAGKILEFVASGTVTDPLPPKDPWWAMGFGRVSSTYRKPKD